MLCATTSKPGNIIGTYLQIIPSSIKLTSAHEHVTFNKNVFVKARMQI